MSTMLTLARDHVSLFACHRAPPCSAAWLCSHPQLCRSDALEEIGNFAAEAQAAQGQRRARRQAAAAKHEAAKLRNATAASFGGSWRDRSGPSNPRRKVKLSDAPLSMDGGGRGDELD